MKLPIVTKPIMNTTNSCSYSFGIVEQYIDCIDRLLCTRFINCIYNKIDSPHFFVYDNDLWFDQCGLTECDPHNISPHVGRESLEEQIKIVREELIKGFYVYGRYNEKYITAMHNEVFWDNDHDYLLLGFDDDRQIYYSIGYVDGIYREFEISYSDYFEANYHSLQGCVNLFCFRISPDYAIPELSIEETYKAFCSYRDGRVPEFEVLPAFQNGDIIAGQKAWDYLPVYLESFDLGEREYIDMRNIHAYVDHKEGMARRIRYLHQAGVLSDAQFVNVADDIRKKANIAFNLMIKYRITGEERARESAIGAVCQANNAEKCLLEHVIDG